MHDKDVALLQSFVKIMIILKHIAQNYILTHRCQSDDFYTEKQYLNINQNGNLN